MRDPIFLALFIPFELMLIATWASALRRGRASVFGSHFPATRLEHPKRYWLAMTKHAFFVVILGFMLVAICLQGI
jgi:hypothetical protein